jgi:hypothetical protein
MRWNTRALSTKVWFSYLVSEIKRTLVWDVTQCSQIDYLILEECIASIFTVKNVYPEGSTLYRHLREDVGLAVFNICSQISIHLSIFSLINCFINSMNEITINTRELWPPIRYTVYDILKYPITMYSVTEIRLHQRATRTSSSLWENMINLFIR